MSSDDFLLIPQRIPEREYVAFKKWLLEKALDEESEYLFTFRYADVGLSLKYLLEVYEAGKESKIPEAWVPLYKEMKQEQSTEYQTYLRLKEKYEERCRVAEITIEKAFNPKEEDVDQGSTKKHKKTTPSRGIKRDGMVSSFY